MGRTRDYDLAQNKSLTLGPQTPEGWQIRSLWISNLTPFPIHLPNNPSALQWVLPNVTGAVMPVPPGVSLQINTQDVPPGSVAIANSLLIAHLTAFEDALPPSPGYPVPTSNIGVFKSAFQRQVNAGGTNLVAPVAGLTTYIWGALFSVDTPLAGAFATLTDDNGNQLMCQIQANTAHSVAFSPMYGVNLGAGRGARLSVILANAAVGCSIIYQQQ